MKTEKQFIAITSEVYNEKLVHLCTSTGQGITDENGIGIDNALEFLFNLIYKRKRVGGLVFVVYGFSRDNEFIFSTLPSDLRDKLFRSYRIKKQINELEFEIENIAEDFYKHPLHSEDYELADFELHVNRIALDELSEVKYKGYDLELANGKLLTIRKHNKDTGKTKSITIYDIFGFFKPQSLRESVQRMLGETQPLLDRNTYGTMDFFDGASDIEKLKAHASFEVDYVQRLAVRLNEKFIENDIHLSRFHGASALASYVLSKSKAKSQFHNYRHRRQFSPEQNLALRQSLYGGRSEQFKIGTLENVNVYDINSAYAFAATQLPIMLSKPQPSPRWQDIDFSYWYCEYDFTDINPYFGYLPNREATNFTKYKLKGNGYFWQPEIKYILRHFPQCVEIGNGYTLEADRAEFSQAIENLYNLRQYLQNNKDSLERVIKLALSSIYGKFCQHNGKGYYYNLFYAAYITSVTRAQLLEATQGFEHDVICFQTDAIHSTAELPLNLSNSLGEYKRSTYDKVTYLDNGVYQCYNDGNAVKTKTRGFRKFNFSQALVELTHKQTYTALAEFFMGHNLFTQNVFTSANYLADVAAPKTMRPVERDRFAMRHFLVDSENIDLTKTFIDSKAISHYSGLGSSPYNVGRNDEANSCLSTLQSGRI